MKHYASICDWLPPEFGAVGQYALLFAREHAEAGGEVTLVGLSSTADSETVERFPSGGLLRIRRVRAPHYEKSRLLQRAWWTLKVNLKLLWCAHDAMRRADEVLFTGSPPFFLHFIAPLNLLLRQPLVYRITDFHPECLMAEFERVPLGLRLLHRYTLFWRRRIPRFEALGEDQIARLAECGIDPSRVTLKRDPSPVTIPPGTPPLPLPEPLVGKVVLLYSGNFGVAHDHLTVVEAYRRHHREGSGRVHLWLNAVGAKADLIEQALKSEGLPVHRSRPVPIEQLPQLLVTPHAHLISLRDGFVGYVLPSKVYGCVASAKPVVYIGSRKSDVDLVCRQGLPAGDYFQADSGDVDGAFRALEALGQRAG